MNTTHLQPTPSPQEHPEWQDVVFEKLPEVKAQQIIAEQPQLIPSDSTYESLQPLESHLYNQENHTGAYAKAVTKKIGRTIVAQERRAQEDAIKLAYTDELTGFSNFRAFKKAKERLSNTENESLVLIDLMNFKSANDALGQEGGDIILQGFADCVRELIVQRGWSSRVAFHLGSDEPEIGIGEQGELKLFAETHRYGGDEFAVVLPIPKDKISRAEGFSNILVGKYDKKLIELVRQNPDWAKKGFVIKYDEHTKKDTVWVEREGKSTPLGIHYGAAGSYEEAEEIIKAKKDGRDPNERYR